MANNQNRNERRAQEKRDREREAQKADIAALVHKAVEEKLSKINSENKPEGTHTAPPRNEEEKTDERTADIPNTTDIMMAFCTFGMLVVVIFQAYFNSGQVDEARKANAVATTAANAARDSVVIAQKAMDAAQETSRLDQRAWVTVSSIHILGDFSHARNSKLEVISSNTGQTPALEWRVVVGTVYKDRELDKPGVETLLGETTKLKDISKGILGPNLQPSAEAETDASTYPEFRRVLGDKPFYLYVFGRMEYKDIFDRAHYTTFCFYRMTDTPNSNIGFTIAEFGNETDESENSKKL